MSPQLSKTRSEPGLGQVGDNYEQVPRKVQSETDLGGVITRKELSLQKDNGHSEIYERFTPSTTPIEMCPLATRDTSARPNSKKELAADETTECDIEIPEVLETAAIDDVIPMDDESALQMSFASISESKVIMREQTSKSTRNITSCAKMPAVKASTPASLSIGIETIDGSALDPKVNKAQFWNTQLIRCSKAEFESLSLKSTFNDPFATESSKVLDPHYSTKDKTRLDNTQQLIDVSCRNMAEKEDSRPAKDQDVMMIKSPLRPRISSAIQRIPSAKKQRRPWTTIIGDLSIDEKNRRKRTPQSRVSGSHVVTIQPLKMSKAQLLPSGQALLIVEHQTPVSLVKDNHKQQKIKTDTSSRCLTTTSQNKNMTNKVTFTGRPYTSIVSSTEPLSDIIQRKLPRKHESDRSSQIPKMYSEIAETEGGNDGMLHVKLLELDVVDTQLPRLVTSKTLDISEFTKESIKPHGCWNGSNFLALNSLSVPENPSSLPPRTPVHILKLQESAEFQGETAMGLKTKQEITKKLTVLEPQLKKGKWIILESLQDAHRNKSKKLKAKLLSHVCSGIPILPSISPPVLSKRPRIIKEPRTILPYNGLTVQPLNFGYLDPFLLENIALPDSTGDTAAAQDACQNQVLPGSPPAQTIQKHESSNSIPRKSVKIRNAAIEKKDTEGLNSKRQSHKKDFILQEAEYKMMTATPCPWKFDDF